MMRNKKSFIVFVVVALIFSLNIASAFAGVRRNYVRKPFIQPVYTAPVTPAPVTPTPETPTPVTPIPVTPIPVTPIPVTPIPVTPIPVTPTPVTPTPIISTLLLFADSFESGTIDSSWEKEYANISYSAAVVSTRSRDGNKSLRMELRKSDPDVSGSKRTEIVRDNEKPLEEHWYSFSTYLPAGGDEDYALDPGSAEILTQWHNIPDSGEEWTSPPLSLMTTGSGNYSLYRLWDSSTLSTTSSIKAKGNTASHNLGSYVADKGKWVDWKFHVKWGWLSSQNPTIQVYKNGVKVLDLTGLPNTMNDQNGVYMKMGIYKWDWKENPAVSSISKRVVYYDGIAVN